METAPIVHHGLRLSFFTSFIRFSGDPLHIFYFTVLSSCVSSVPSSHFLILSLSEMERKMRRDGKVKRRPREGTCLSVVHASTFILSSHEVRRRRAERSGSK